MHSANLRGKPEGLKQNSWGALKVWWAPVLMRGKLHVVVFDASYPGETPEGAEALVAAVRGAVNKRFQGGATKPDTLMVDRGRGFYNNATGNVTKKYQGGAPRARVQEHDGGQRERPTRAHAGGSPA